MTLYDAHCHFFTARFFETLGREKCPGRRVGAQEIANELWWDAVADPDALADRWVSELDQHNVSRAAIMASVQGDEESVAAAVVRHPSRLVGFFAINASDRDAPERAERAFARQGLRCACLFPAMHHYS